MNEFITVRTFDLPTDLVVVRLKIEEAGIEYIVVDELTVQSYNFLSNAIGGVKLQVRKSDFERANELFEEWGYPQGKLLPTMTERILSDPKQRKQLSFMLVGFIILIAVVALVALVSR